MKQSTFILVLVGMLLGCSVMGQSIHGTVGYEAYHKSDTLVERWGQKGVTVTLMPGGSQQTTDSLGNYSFGPLDPWAHTPSNPAWKGLVPAK